jgi:hypothetical protein
MRLHGGRLTVSSPRLFSLSQAEFGARRGVQPNDDLHVTAFGSR